MTCSAMRMFATLIPTIGHFCSFSMQEFSSPVSSSTVNHSSPPKSKNELYLSAREDNWFFRKWSCTRNPSSRAISSKSASLLESSRSNREKRAIRLGCVTLPAFILTGGDDDDRSLKKP